MICLCFEVQLDKSYNNDDVQVAGHGIQAVLRASKVVDQEGVSKTQGDYSIQPLKDFISACPDFFSWRLELRGIR